MSTHDGSAKGGEDELRDILERLTGRRLAISDVCEAVGLKSRGHYTKERKNGKLITPDRMFAAATRLGISPVELLTECGILPRNQLNQLAERDADDLVGEIGKLVGEIRRRIPPGAAAQPPEAEDVNDFSELKNFGAPINDGLQKRHERT